MKKIGNAGSIDPSLAVIVILVAIALCAAFFYLTLGVVGTSVAKNASANTVQAKQERYHVTAVSLMGYERYKDGSIKLDTVEEGGALFQKTLHSGNRFPYIFEIDLPGNRVWYRTLGEKDWTELIFNNPEAFSDLCNILRKHGDDPNSRHGSESPHTVFIF